MKVEKQSIIYISGVSEATIQQIHELGNFWASGGSNNFCMTVENAKEIPELKSLLENESDGDVIINE